MFRRLLNIFFSEPKIQIENDPFYDWLLVNKKDLILNYINKYIAISITELKVIYSTEDTNEFIKFLETLERPEDIFPIYAKSLASYGIIENDDYAIEEEL